MKTTDRYIWIFTVLVSGTLAEAQLGGQGPSAPLPQARPIPLSGRQQNGTVIPSQRSATGAATGSINTVTPSVEIQGAYQGSTPTGQVVGQPLALTFQDAIQRAIRYNLGTIGAGEAARQARAQRLASLAELLPDVTGSVRESLQQVNLVAQGLRIQLPVPGFHFPSVVTFNNFDARARFTESLSLPGIHNWRSSSENARSAELSLQDSRELVALAVAASYLQSIATAARIETAKAQLETAKVIHQQALDRNQSGLAARIDVNRALVEQQAQEERLLSLTSDFEKQKLALARLIGLPMAQAFTLADTIPYRDVPAPDLNQLITHAWSRRADVQAAAAQVKVAESSHKAAIAEYCPSLVIAGDYGGIGITPSNQFHSAYTISGGIQVQIFRSGRIRADIQQADAALHQRRAELEDSKARAEQDVRNAVLDLNTASQQVKVAESNRQLAAATLVQARDRFRSGIADTIELVQAQESVATSEQDYINSLYSLNLAQVSLARATGETEQGITRLLQGK